MKNHGGCEYSLVCKVTFAHTLAHPRNSHSLQVVSIEQFPFFLCARLEVDVSRLTVNERQFYSYMLNPGKGRVVFLITLRSVWGVSISDIENATLSKPDEKDEVVEKFVCFSFLPV